MADQLPAVIVLAPLFGALFIALAGPRDHRVCFPVVLAALLVSLVASFVAARTVFAEGPIDYFMGGWEHPRGIGIQLRIDALNAPVLLVIGVVSVLVAFFSIRRAGEKHAEKTPQFYVLYLLLCVGVFGITVAADAFNLFVLVEVSSLTSYGLIAMGSSRRGTRAAFNYLLMGTVGASFYLLGVGYLYLETGTLNMREIHAILAEHAAIAESKPVTIGFLLILVGTWIKMAFFPLYGWLPNAYSYCPSSSACLLAPLMTKVSVYVMLRVMITVFGVEWVFHHLGWSHLVVWLAVVAILAGSVLALAQVEIKKMLCYLIVAEVGYMVGGAWLADPDFWGMTGAIYHLLADAAMTLCVFLAAGIFARRLGVHEIGDLEGLFRRAPWTAAAFVVGGLALIGVPPTCGFFSKFYLIRGGIEGGHWEYVVALLVSSLVNAVLFFRLFEVAFFGRRPADGHGAVHSDGEHYGEHPTPSQRGTPDHSTPSTDVSPRWWNALLPLYAAVAAILLLGLFNGQVVEWIRVALEGLPSPAALSK